MFRKYWHNCFSRTAGVLTLIVLSSIALNLSAAVKTPLDPLSQPKFVNPLPSPQVVKPDTVTHPGFEYYELAMTQFEQHLGIVDPATGQPLLTTVWGYDGSYPGPTIEARSTLAENTVRPGLPVKVLWSNELYAADGVTPLAHLLPVDTTLHCGTNAAGANSNCRPLVRTVVHLHGGHTDADSDGHPEAWFTAGFTQGGPSFKPQMNGVYTYRNDQESAPLWYHDHAMGITRLNVYAGLAGFYLLRDDREDRLVQRGVLPSGAYEIPLLIQDRSFYTDGSLAYPNEPFIDPATGQVATLDPITGEPVPSVVPEFFGDTILVNGKTWPVLDVEPRKYRFRVLNGSNSRFYNMKFDWVKVGGGSIRLKQLKFRQVGSDGGLLNRAVKLKTLSLAPAERADIIVDFSDNDLAGKTIILSNNAPTPFPFGAPVDPATTGKIMAFRVTKPLNTLVPDTRKAKKLRQIPIASLVPTPGAPTRELVLVENMDELGRLMPLLGTSAAGGLLWSDPTTETPLLGSTEIWSIINATPDTHPVHKHLVQFQIIDRQAFDADVYIPGQPETLALLGRKIRPEPEEAGWKDTAQAHPGEVIRVIANYDLLGEYVWHCHILEHEDHEMMRKFEVIQ
ncbi:MAG: multicopper oxidase domain-containing protein [Gammaproteobacteria bacterium]|nr:multicopper oxidase domain-containing protein [Gammaproteobacteria bacterium]